MNITEITGGVVIGRNEGQRLATCLESLIKHLKHIVYVDSGSTDDSIDIAKKLGVEIIPLDMSTPFTAARARNEGANYLDKKYKNLKYIQFIDGDCELQSKWLKLGFDFLEKNDEYAIACGRCRERYPEKTIYNQLCDIEWNTSVGDIDACGGIALVRFDAYRSVNGFRNDLIAGEEPEMCFRLREKGWKIRRIDAEMALHDAAMTKFSQWWKRTIRAGYAFTLCSSIHGKSEEKLWVRERNRIIGWGIFMPVAILLLSLQKPIFLVLFMVYPIQILRVFKNKELSVKDSIKLKWAFFTVFGKFPESIGLFKCLADNLTKKRSVLIEYK